MGEVVSIAAERRERTETAEAAWEAYLAARDRAELTRKADDAFAAGRAWARFLSLFTRGAA